MNERGWVAKINALVLVGHGHIDQEVVDEMNESRAKKGKKPFILKWPYYKYVFIGIPWRRKP